MKQACTLITHVNPLLIVVLTITLSMGTSVFAADTAPCAANADSRQLDYWLGDWSISGPGSTGMATSTVTASLDKCVVVEQWSDGKGHNGENIFGYSPNDKGWRGFFADNRGHVHAFVDGKVSSGTAEFTGPSRGPNGESVLNRIRIVRLSPDKAEQTWDKSTDNGATWIPQFRLEYTRKSS